MIYRVGFVFLEKQSAMDNELRMVFNFLLIDARISIFMLLNLFFWKKENDLYQSDQMLKYIIISGF